MERINNRGLKGIKYKCMDCGTEFYGTKLTKKCTNDVSERIKQSGNFPWKKVLIAVAIVALIASTIAIILLVEDSEKEYSIKVSQNETKVCVEVLCENDTLDLKELSDSCQVIVLDSTEATILGPMAFLKSSKIRIDKSEFEPGCTYNFRLCKKKGGEILDSASITLPMPPSKPIIKIDVPKPEMDVKDNCRYLGTYKVVIRVTKGQADKFVLDGKEYKSNIITGVKPRPKKSPYVIVRAYDSQNDIWSDSVSYKLPPINTSSVSAPEQATIQGVFDKVAKRDLMVGDAMDVITGGENVTVIDGNKKSNLEEILQVSYQKQNRIVIKKVNYAGTDCSKVIKSIVI